MGSPFASPSGHCAPAAISETLRHFARCTAGLLGASSSKSVLTLGVAFGRSPVPALFPAGSADDIFDDEGDGNYKRLQCGEWWQTDRANPLMSLARDSIM